MELYEAISKRKTTREFLEKEVDFEVIKKILKAGNKAPHGIITVIGSLSC